MGKKKDKKEKVIPKRIAGVKVPKELRRRGEALIQQAASPEGRAVLAKGLAAAAALASARANAARPERAANDAGGPAPDAAKLAHTVGIVANEVLGRLFTGRR